MLNTSMISTKMIHYFQDEPVPMGCSLVGYAALIDKLDVRAPLRRFSCLSEKFVKGSKRDAGIFDLYDKRYATDGTLVGHLSFAVRNEKIDLLVLKRIFQKLPVDELLMFIRSTPTGVVSRKIWFLYEMLMGQQLDLPDAPVVTAVDVLDCREYFTTTGELSLRHRVRNNLLGDENFCPIIQRTKRLEMFISSTLAQKAQMIVGKTSANLIARASSFMLLADSRASFEIEGERPQFKRLERWGKAVLEAGKRPLSQDELYRLHRILIGDDRFTEIGYRSEGVFLGERDYYNDPLPEFIGASPVDLDSLMCGLLSCNQKLRQSDLDPILQAASIAFGFVFIHPLADGNGRLHRCIIHHVLAERKFSPPGMVFPVSSVMLDRIENYKNVLQAHSSVLMPYIDWKVTKSQNVEVLNDTSDLYRFCDCTEVAEFLYGCVQRTVDTDLPREVEYLKRYDEALQLIMNHVEMPDQLAQSLIMFIRQNQGRLAKKRREKEFQKLTDDEIHDVEVIVNTAFDGFDLQFLG